MVAGDYADVKRQCCNSLGQDWHAEDCRVGGPTGPVVGEFMHAGTDIVRELAGMKAVQELAPEMEWEPVGCPPKAHHTSDGICVGHSPGDLIGGCAPDHDWHFTGRRNGKSYARERILEMQELAQRVVMPLYRNGRWPVHVIHDNVPNDRTFENETRPH